MNYTAQISYSSEIGEYHHSIYSMHNKAMEDIMKQVQAMVLMPELTIYAITIVALAMA